MKGLAQRLILKQSNIITRKWPTILCHVSYSSKSYQNGDKARGNGVGRLNQGGIVQYFLEQYITEYNYM